MAICSFQERTTHEDLKNSIEMSFLTEVDDWYTDNAMNIS